MPWGFAAGSGSIFGVPAWSSRSRSSSSSRRKEEGTGGKSSKNHISFSMGFRSYIRQFLGAILMLFRPSLPWGFAAESGSIFGVAACHRSSRSRRSSSSSSRKQEEKVATIIFSMGFRKVAGSMGFRSYIRQFLGAILMLFRPSLPWGFAAGNGLTIGAAACHRSSRIRSSSSSSSRKQEEKVATIIFSIGFRRVAGAGAAAAGGNRRKKSLKSSFSMGFRSYIRQFSGAILMLSVLHCHGDLLLGVFDFWRRSLPPHWQEQEQQQGQQQETGGKSSYNHFFL